MAIKTQYKKYQRGQRQASVETSFENGMMFSEGAVSDGYVKTLVNFDFTEDGRSALKPRAALTTREVITPDMLAIFSTTADEEEFLAEDTVLKYVKECVENGEVYRQIIFGKPDVAMVGDAPVIQDTGKIWVETSRKRLDDFEDVIVSDSVLLPSPSECAFYSTSLTEIHETELISDAKTSFPVGTFMGNSFYFFSKPSSGVLKKTVYDAVNSRYKFEAVTATTPSASEAVNYGYNMLLGNSAYSFSNGTTASSFQMEGILPYDAKFDGVNTPNLMMVPKANKRVWFNCNYNVQSGVDYKIVWSWKEAGSSDDWTVFNNEWDANNPFDSTNTPALQADLICPAKEIMIRCEAYNINVDPDIVERAMTVGFDFTINADSTTTNTTPEKYDLSTATGMASWKNRLVVWGLPKDPTILFISDLDEPAYFPYPNNVTIFDEPIIAVTELMDNLVVFTTSKVYQVSFNADGYTWTSTVIQSNLYIEPWDKHLIQSVRNMLYFKSGNYYYMIVPKAQSTTGELTIAPITTPITEFFNHFSANVSLIFRDCFKTLDSSGNLVIYDPTSPDIDHPNDGLVTYYNFINYESIHNFYVYRYHDVYVHFDIIYNVVNRYWKINIYESAHFLFPFKNEATQSGLMAGSSIMSIYNDDAGVTVPKRVIQLFDFNSIEVEDIYIPAGSDFIYSTDAEDIYVSDETCVVPGTMGSYSDEVATINKAFVRMRELPNETLWLVDTADYVGGFSRVAFKDSLDEAVAELRDTTIFPNKQMLDTGYRDDNLHLNKRYRELQLQINNPDDVDMEFGMDFQIAGEPRNTDYLYEVSQTIDEINQDQGIVYIDATPYMYEEVDHIDKINQWILKHDIDSKIKVSLWKVRAAVSGKGTAPRLRLFTRKMFNYQLLGLNWIYREMNMR